MTFNGQNYLVSGTSASTAFTSGMAAAYADKSKKPLSTADAFIRSALAPKTPVK